MDNTPNMVMSSAQFLGQKMRYAKFLSFLPDRDLIEMINERPLPERLVEDALDVPPVRGVPEENEGMDVGDRFDGLE